MGTTQTKSLRLPEYLLKRVLEEADRLGVSFNEFTIHALEKTISGEGDPAITFLGNLAAWVENTFDRRSFRNDVTLQVFHHIRDDEATRATYDELIHKDDGETDFEALISVHRRIGRMVKRVLGAEIEGRSAPLDPREHLIRSHALLKPGSE